MVEVGPALVHAHASDCLPDGHAQQTECDCERRGYVRLVVWEEEGGEGRLDEGEGVGKGIGDSIVGEEEGGEVCLDGVAEGGDVVFEEVEDAEGEEEEGWAPEMMEGVFSDCKGSVWN